MLETLRIRPLRLLAPLILFAALVLPARRARADDAVGNDEVTLKNGGSIRGTVVSAEPGKAVTMLELGQQSPRVIPWDEVSGVVRDRFASGPLPDPPPALPFMPPPGGPALVPGAPGVVQLHVASPVPVALFKHRHLYASGGGNVVTFDRTRTVCEAPCDLLVDARLGREFSVGGRDAVESSRFSLAGTSGNQTVVVSPGSPGLRTGGNVLMTLGSIAIGVGTLGAVVGAVGTKPNPAGDGFVRNEGLENAGFATIGAGATAIVGAIVMIIASRTTVDVHPTQTAHAEVKPRWWAGEF